MAKTAKPAHPEPSSGKTLGKRHAFAIATMMMMAMLTFLTAIVIIGYCFLRYQYIDEGPLSSEHVFEIPKGAGLSQIANKLETENVIGSPMVFKTFVKFDGGETSLKAGEYVIPPQSSMRDVYEIFQKGKVILYPITIAEGLTSAQIVRLINDNPSLSGHIDTIPAEGSLLPETYMVPKSMTKAALIAKMQTAMTTVLDQAWSERSPDLPYETKEQALILASIVEKETGVKSERERVAGVFVNRLNRKMRLESDPTIIYGISRGEPLGRGLRRSEIDTKTPWNTYQIDGLPKTPICNPGAASIKAVMHPMQTRDIFFVADGSGGHVFAETLAGHNKNVRAWRAIEKKRKQAKKQ